MSCEADTETLLRSGGRRSMWQRQVVALALRHAGGHCTAEELRPLVQGRDASTRMPLSTVYRLPRAGDAEGAAPGLRGGCGRSRCFEWVDREQPHHHLVCVRCGGERELDPALLRSLGEAIRGVTGFEAYLDHLALTGRCARCAEAADGDA